MAKQLTKLQAVNIMLGFVGSAPVNSLEAAGRIGSQAEVIINNNTANEQNRRLWFNTQVETFTPDVNGEILLPENVLEVSNVNHYDDKFSMQDGKLYNKVDNSFIFTGDVEANVLYALEFEETPYAFQYFIAMVSTRDLYQIRYPKDNIPQYIQEKFLRAEGELNKHNIKTMKMNLGDNPALGVRRGW